MIISLSSWGAWVSTNGAAQTGHVRWQACWQVGGYERVGAQRSWCVFLWLLSFGQAKESDNASQKTNSYVNSVIFQMLFREHDEVGLDIY